MNLQRTLILPAAGALLLTWGFAQQAPKEEASWAPKFEPAHYPP